MENLGTDIEDIERLLSSWYAHPITKFLVDTAKDDLKHNLTRVGKQLCNTGGSVEYHAGYLAGENKVLHDIISPRDWLIKELDLNYGDVGNE